MLAILARLPDARHMPILTDIMNHKVIGPAIRQGIQQGVQQGLQQGVQQGEAAVLSRLLAKRFGPLPEWVETRLNSLSRQQLEELSDRLLDARSLDELLPD